MYPICVGLLQQCQTQLFLFCCVTADSDSELYLDVNFVIIKQ